MTDGDMTPIPMTDEPLPPGAMLYDNPATMCRELWFDGRVVAEYLASNLLTTNMKGRLGFEQWGYWPAPNAPRH